MPKQGSKRQVYHVINYQIKFDLKLYKDSRKQHLLIHPEKTFDNSIIREISEHYFDAGKFSPNVC